MENNFVHLNLHTEYSLLEGVNSIDSFLTRAKELGMNSLAVTDYANMFCAIEFYEKAKKMGIKPIIGLELPLYEKEEQNIFTLTYNIFNKCICIINTAYACLQINNMNTISSIINILLHLRIPFILLMTEMNTCFKQILN